MRISFPGQDSEYILNKIKDKIANRKIGQMISFQLTHSDLKITIKKMGVSYFSFRHETHEGNLIWHLKNEKVAFSHRPFKKEVFEKLADIVEDLGGSVQK